MTQYEKYQEAVRLLKELNCPKAIMEALWLFGMTVHNDQEKAEKWLITSGKLIEAKVKRP